MWESINKNLDMGDWIADDDDDYVDKAISFSNKKLLNNIKKKLDTQNTNSVLFDSKKFSNEFVGMVLKLFEKLKNNFFINEKRLFFYYFTNKIFGYKL